MCVCVHENETWFETDHSVTCIHVHAHTRAKNRVNPNSLACVTSSCAAVSRHSEGGKIHWLQNKSTNKKCWWWCRCLRCYLPKNTYYTEFLGRDRCFLNFLSFFCPISRNYVSSEKKKYKYFSCFRYVYACFLPCFSVVEHFALVFSFSFVKKCPCSISFPLPRPRSSSNPTPLLWKK